MLTDALNRSLQREGYACDVTAGGLSAVAFLASYRYDAIILDLMLLRLDGLGVLRELSWGTSRARVAGPAVDAGMTVTKAGRSAIWRLIHAHALHIAKVAVLA